MSDYSNVTFMVCLPRSRSAWLCAFLNPIAVTMHDPLKHCASIADLGVEIDHQRLVSGVETPIFVADTAAVFFYDQITMRFPGAKYFFVFRSPTEVSASLAALGAVNEHILHVQAIQMAALDHINKEKSIRKFWIGYHRMDEYIPAIWQFVGGEDIAMPTREWIKKMTPRNIQIPIREQNRLTNIEKVTKLFHTRTML